MGAEACWPLADFATSRGRGAGRAAFPVAAIEVAADVSTLAFCNLELILRLSPFPLLAGTGTVPAFAKKFFVTETALKVMGFLTEFERAWCGPSDTSLLPGSDVKGFPASVSDPASVSTPVCSAGTSAGSRSWSFSIDDIRRVDTIV